MWWRKLCCNIGIAPLKNQPLHLSDDWNRVVFRLAGVLPDSAVLFNSAMMPVKLTFRTITGSDTNKEYTVIFKQGDDLRLVEFLKKLILQISISAKKCYVQWASIFTHLKKGKRESRAALLLRRVDQLRSVLFGRGRDCFFAHIFHRNLPIQAFKKESQGSKEAVQISENHGAQLIGRAATVMWCGSPSAPFSEVH